MSTIRNESIPLDKPTIEKKMLTRAECLEFYKKIDMPPHIRRHCMLVAEVSLFLGRLLNCNGSRLDLNMIEIGALLHDVGKERSLVTGEDHAVLGAEMLTGIAPPGATRIVREHIWLEPSHIEGPITESLLVNYSDKRVKHEEVVSVEARYHDLIARYAKTPVHRRRLLEKLNLYLELEKKIFLHLNIEPKGREIMGIKLTLTEGAGSENNGNKEAHCGIAGGGEIG